MNIKKIFSMQKEFFYTDRTKELSFRIDALRKLKSVIKENEHKIIEAIYKDFKKSEFETYETEIGIIYNEINYTIKNLKKWMKPTKVSTPYTLKPAKSFIQKDPYGVVLIIAPWNYPFQLAISPLIGAIAAGNCVILKPSEISSNKSKLLDEIINKAFEEQYIKVIEGSVEETKELLSLDFDYIFFTGSIEVGKIVMVAAANHLTPVTLELGGKSPCIIDETANLDLAVKRVAWGKFLNAGQTCVAPDYVLIHKSIKNEFVKKMEKTITRFYSDDPQKSKDFPRIINENHFKRLETYLNDCDILIGGTINLKDRYISPTLIENMNMDSEVMKDEIFGPILPIISYDKEEEVIDIVRSKSKPLALYIFSNNDEMIDIYLNSLHFGGGTINDTILHLANHNLPFGGVGLSGLGSYHGKKSFDTFTHEKSILKKANFLDMFLRYPPYNSFKMKVLRWLFK